MLSCCLFRMLVFNKQERTEQQVQLRPAEFSEFNSSVLVKGMISVSALVWIRLRF